MQTTNSTYSRIAEQLKKRARSTGSGDADALTELLLEPATVERFDSFSGEWVAEASGSSVAWLAGAADDFAVIEQLSTGAAGKVRVVNRYGEVLAQ